MKFEWKEQSRIRGVDPPLAGECLAEIRAVSQGLLTPAGVVDDARPEESVLHPAFEWDDSIAAEEHRRQQARHLVGGLRVVVETPEEARSTRAYVHVRIDEHEGYALAAQVMTDEALREQVVRRAWVELQSWIARYRELKEMARIVQAVDSTQEEMW